MSTLSCLAERLRNDPEYAEALRLADIVYVEPIFAGKSAPAAGVEGETEVLPPEPRVRCDLRGADAGLFLGPIPAGVACGDLKQRLALLAHLADGLIVDLRVIGDANAERAACRLELVREQVCAISPNLQGLIWTEDVGQ